MKRPLTAHVFDPPVHVFPARRSALLSRLVARLSAWRPGFATTNVLGLTLTMVALALALYLRLNDLDAFVTVDEPTWAGRSQAFHQALLERNYAATYLSSHPGVTTMWLGTLAILLRGSSTLGRTELLFSARPFVALSTWLTLVAMCWMAFRLWGGSVALLGAVLIGLDPFLLAHSRLYHLDGLVACLMGLSLLSLMVFLTKGQRRYLLLSAACGSLAALTKSTAGFLFPLGAVVILAYSGGKPRGGERTLSRVVSSLSLWAFVAALVFLFCWPAMWVQPLETLSGVLHGAQYYARTPHESLNYFMGQPRADPGAWFYPVVLILRSSPITFVGILASLAMLFHRSTKRYLTPLHLFVLLFCACMTIGAKKFDRYVLPAFPVADLAAALGWSSGVNWAARRWQAVSAHQLSPQRATLGVSLCLLLAQLALVLPFQPHYLSYYNPLMGGPAAAFRMMWMGWGEGMDRVAGYLNNLPNAGQLRVASWYGGTLRPLFEGQVQDISDAPNVTTDYFVLYANQIQRHPDAMARYCGPKGPEHTIILGGAEYAWICTSDYQLRAVTDYIRSHQQPGDALLADNPSPSLAQALDMPYVYADDTGSQLVPSLLEQLEGAPRAWMVYLPEEPPGAARRQLAAWGRIALYRVPASLHPSVQMVPASVRWRSGVALTGLGVANVALDADQALALSLRWRVQDLGHLNASLSLRVIDAEGHVWGMVDRWLLSADGKPTSGWDPDQDYVTHHLVQLLVGIPPGPYQLVAALADGVDGRTLEISDHDLPTSGATLHLRDVQIVTPARALDPGHLTELQPTSLRLAHGILLSGTRLPPEPLQPGDALPISLLWQADRRPDHRYQLRMQLHDQEGRLIDEWMDPPIASYGTDKWRRGEIFRGQYEMRVSADAPVGEHHLRAWLEPEGADSGSAPPQEAMWVETVEVEARQRIFEMPTSAAYPEEYVLGDQVRLLGYDVSRTGLHRGESLRLTLYWQAERSMTTSWTVFTHLLDEMSQIWGQRDGAPVGGTYPTIGWLEGEIVRDEYEIAVRSDAPAGEYRLEIGMYDPQSGSRLGVVDGQGVVQEGDRALLGAPIEIDIGQ